MKKKDTKTKLEQQIEQNNQLIASAKTLMSKMNKLTKRNHINVKESLFFIEKLNPSKGYLQQSLLSMEKQLSSNTIKSSGSKKDNLSYKVFRKKTI
jgi:hypothetical protein